jgi:hypothetical protein
MLRPRKRVMRSSTSPATVEGSRVHEPSWWLVRLPVGS